MQVELLFWDGCPSYTRAERDLREAMAAAGLDPSTLQMREVSTESAARSEAFAGSPTIRIDGRDVQPTGAPAGLSCRVYRLRDGRYSPTPDPADVQDALREAIQESGRP